MKRLIAAAAAVGVAFSVAAPASANPIDALATAFCADLYANPTPAQVDYSARLLLSNGWTAQEAAEFMVLAVQEYCPSNAYVLRAYAKSAKSGQVV
jgi:hypothetical protein